MSNESGFNEFDEWLMTQDKDIKLNIDWDKKIIKGAEVRGVYVKQENFNKEIWNTIHDLIHRGRLAYEFIVEELE